MLVLQSIFAAVGFFSLAYYAVIKLSFGPSISFSRFWLAAGVGLLLISYIIRRCHMSNGKASKIIVAVICAVSLTALGTVALVEAEIIKAGNRKAEESADYLLVLGAQVIGNTPSNSLQLRIDGAAEYLNENKNTIAVASGGKGSGENISEAQAIFNGLVDKGIDEGRIIMEDKSESTLENIEFSRDYISDGSSVVIVTNKFHILRACGIAKKHGYKNVSGLSVPSNKYLALNCYVREFFAIVKEKALKNF